MKRLRTEDGVIHWHAQGMQHVPTGEAWMDERLATRLRALRFAKRRDESRLGRWTAKQTIALAAGIATDAAALREIHVLNAPDGAPEALHGEQPLAAVIAMTDRADWAVCAIMGGTARVGCDLELVEPRSAEFVADYFTAAEQRRVEASGDPALFANLIWSAKESALKVLRTGLRRDTRSVEVTVEDGPPGKWAPLSVQDLEGDRFPGWWLRCGSFILTVAAQRRTPPPVSLVEPPLLFSAEPGHAWLQNPLG